MSASVAGLEGREAAAAEELLHTMRWSVGSVHRGHLSPGHSQRMTADGVHFAYLSAGSATLHAVTGSADKAVREAAVDEVSLAPGDFLLLPRGGAVRLQNDGSSSVRFVLGSLVLDAGAFQHDAHLLPAVLFSCSATVTEPVYRGLLEMIDAEIEARGAGGSTVLNRLIDLVVSATLRSWLERGCASASAWLVQVRDPRLGRVLEAIHAEPGTPWTVESLARVAHSSRSRFAELFRGAVGETPARYLTRVRMRRAEQLLLAGWPVSRIAFDLGYDSDEGFRRAFQRHSGSAPTSWRRSRTNRSAIASASGSSPDDDALEDASA